MNDYIDKQIQNKVKYSDEFKMLKWFKHCISAVKYLHEKDLMHRDIKPLLVFFLLLFYRIIKNLFVNN